MSLPPLVTNFVDVDIELVLQSENGILGTGAYPLDGDQDPDLINAAKETATVRVGASFFDSSTSFGMIPPARSTPRSLAPCRSLLLATSPTG